jgi:hypothetical protein
MTTLIAAGDSFTWGSDLSDSTSTQYSNHTWSALTAQYLNADYRCFALQGGSNSSIARRCLHQLESKSKNIEDKVVMVMWTYPHRLEMITKIKHTIEKLDSFLTISSWHGLSFEDKMILFGKMDEGKYDFFLKQHNEFDTIGVNKISQTYNAYMSDDYYYYETFKSMVLLKSYLELNKISYYFLKTTDVEIKTQNPYVISFQALSKTANWLNAPPFYDWAKEKKFEIGHGNHPLEAAHESYFDEFIKPTMNVES